MGKENKIRTWEISLLLALCITLCIGAWATKQQKGLAEKMIRLHVIAASDSPEDQALKLAVRDRVLEAVTPDIDGIQNRAEAEEILNAKLKDLEMIAAETAISRGEQVSAVATLDYEAYPTREYESFSLPAGEYLSLRIVLDEGEGQNWWCVVFPPLCMATAEEEIAPVAGLDEKDISLITEEEGYVLKFKVLELWGQLQERIHKNKTSNAKKHEDTSSTAKTSQMEETKAVAGATESKVQQLDEETKRWLAAMPEHLDPEVLEAMIQMQEDAPVLPAWQLEKAGITVITEE